MMPITRFKYTTPTQQLLQRETLVEDELLALAGLPPSKDPQRISGR